MCDAFAAFEDDRGDRNTPHDRDRRWSHELGAVGRDERPELDKDVALAHRMVVRGRDRDAGVMCVITGAVGRRRGHHGPRDDQAPDQLHAQQASILLRPLRRR